MNKRRTELRMAINVSLPPELAERLHAFADDRVMSPSKVVEVAVARLLASNDGDGQ